MMKRINNTNLIYPTFHKLMGKVAEDFKKETGHLVIIHETWRQPERQQWLYEQGRSRQGPIVTNATQSVHQLGLAVDVIGDKDPIKKGIQGPYDISWETFGAIVLRHGLVWGGQWNDSVHVEMRGPYTIKQLFQMAEENGILWVWNKLEQYYGNNSII